MLYYLHKPGAAIRLTRLGIAMNFVNPLWVGLISGTLLFVLSLESLYVIDTTRQKLKEDSLVNILLLSSDKYYENIVKIGSHLKKIFLNLFQRKPFKNDEKCFLLLESILLFFTTSATIKILLFT